ncbi:efflux RND transporter periplasmic adaptor subunit [Candidatus Ferrigenium straubiae]|jgi:RND family efflux transporter MFP subunit|uniref:efflux RND transporter periplasmic adaptor subunit n=1 Tax=Candidatus Ferrigenium straubiae TaxID=2919506 RepID=UPI003F4AE24A
MKRSILFLLLLPLYVGCSKEPAPAARIERPALTLVAGSAATDVGNTYSGEIRARHETQPGFRVGGKIIERLVDAGARVKAGQALMRLDPGDAGLQLGAAEAQHRMAENDAKRFRELRGKGFVSQAALDAKEAAFEAAAAQAGLARNQSDYTTLRADRAGVVAATLAEAGQVVAAGQPVLRLAPDGEREVAIAVPESQLADLKIGAPAEVTLLTSGAAPLAGRLRELAPAADPASRTYAARVTLSQPGPDVALGMTARVSFSAGKKSDGLLIPLGAIFQQGKEAAVWIVAADRTISLRPVQIAEYRDDGAVVTSGLKAGERIVGNGVHRLAAGEKIRIIESSGAQ